ncbi:Glycosyltransferase involved in cell wall bisynthesis [Cohnella sp. OV330]|uniref:glycosyltransferase family 4 protein n=1 Tax=Cohnella sp. OV330 TaxID=1855288 RepID=UPI0008E9E312|nr:glycosyltransferase family 4 protein [Cohnella sp. OV330]SFB09696.1 Glycosyltransferase involved in cell wall bisynthesis [Cohnella sp. OV330]
MQNKTNKNINVAFLGTYLPRECGLATFTHDLIHEFGLLEDFSAPRVIAVNNNSAYAYGKNVMMSFEQENKSEYARIAHELNRSDVDLLVIQHEFGIYGGECGEYVLELAKRLTIPFIVIFHTVLTAPSPAQRRIVSLLGEWSDRSVTMAQSTVADLRHIYGIPADKIRMYHHGVPRLSAESRDSLKSRYGYAGRQIVSTFGFLSPGKGIEYAIEAMSSVVSRHPDALYVVWGKTHPVVKQEVGEVYRRQLTEQVERLGLNEHVRFVDKLLTQEEVVHSLVLSDIYMTPYLGREQAVSGTLAYGVGYGRVIVSTPYRYATEMLGDGRGLLADFRDAKSLQTQLLDVLDHPDKKLQMERKTAELGRQMMWDQIAKEYAALIRDVVGSSYPVQGSVV